MSTIRGAMPSRRAPKRPASPVYIDITASSDDPQLGEPTSFGKDITNSSTRPAKAAKREREPSLELIDLTDGYTRPPDSSQTSTWPTSSVSSGGSSFSVPPSSACLLAPSSAAVKVHDDDDEGHEGDELAPGSQNQDDGSSSYTHIGTLQTKIVGCRFYNGYAFPGEFVLVLREPNNQVRDYIAS